MSYVPDSYVPDRTGGTEAWEREASAGEARRRRVITGAFLSEEEYERSGWEQAEELITAFVGDPAETILMDFGCGDGRVTAPLASMFPHVVGVDVSPAMLAALEERCLPNVRTFLYRGHGINAAVDAVFSAWVLMHQTWAAGERILGDIADALPAGGRLYLQLPVYELLEHEASWWADIGTFSPERFTATADRAGFEVEKLRASPGAYSSESLGRNHRRLHVLRKL